jgi:hypothetical protein
LDSWWRCARPAVELLLISPERDNSVKFFDRNAIDA